MCAGKVGSKRGSASSQILLKTAGREIDGFGSLFCSEGPPKSHLRIGESCRKRTLSTRGIGPAKRWYCYRGLLCVSTDETQISITIPPRSMVLYHNYFRKMSKMRAPGRPEPPRHSRTSLALKIDTFFKRIWNKNRYFFRPSHEHDVNARPRPSPCCHSVCVNAGL